MLFSTTTSPGRKTDKLVRPLRLVQGRGPGAVAEVGGVNIHAAVAVDGRDRKRLERLCRYIAQPPLSLERLDSHPDGRVRIRFKSAWNDGTHSVLLEPLDFISRLRFLGTACALIPPPRFHMLRYHGVLAGHSRDRAEVVLSETMTQGEIKPELLQLVLPAAAFQAPPPPDPPPRPSRHPLGMAAPTRLRHRHHDVPTLPERDAHQVHRHRATRHPRRSHHRDPCASAAADWLYAAARARARCRVSRLTSPLGPANAPLRLLEQL